MHTADRRHEADRTTPRTWLLGLARTGVLVLCLSSLVQHSCVSSYLVSGNSMQPAFEDGDRVVVARMTPFFTSPHRCDTVIARVDGEILIKRVIGLPGEVVAIGHGHVRLDGEDLDDPVPTNFLDAEDMPPLRLGEDEYFLMGDHRSVSIDSREFGPVSRDDILGRVILRVPRDEETGTSAVAAAQPR